MAQITITGKHLKDSKFLKLVDLLGSEELAIGAIVKGWIVAEKYWLQNCGPIPLDSFHLNKLRPELITSGWAVLEKDKVRIPTTADQFKWLKAWISKKANKKKK